MVLKICARLGLLSIGLTVVACSSPRSRVSDPVDVRPLFGRWRESHNGRAQFHTIRMKDRRMVVDKYYAKHDGDEITFSYRVQHPYSQMLRRDYGLIVKHDLSLDGSSLVGERTITIPEYVPSPDGALPAYPAGTTKSVPIRWERVESHPASGQFRHPLVGTWKGFYTTGGFRKPLRLFITVEEGVCKVNGYPARFKRDQLSWTVRDGAFERRWQLSLRRSGVLAGSVDKTALRSGRSHPRGKATFEKKSNQTWVDSA